VKRRHIRCLHCGLIRPPGSDDEMRAHSATCDKSTVVARVKELEAALDDVDRATHSTGNDDYLLECRQIARAALAKGRTE
jgi:hypothetical protein